MDYNTIKHNILDDINNLINNKNYILNKINYLNTSNHTYTEYDITKSIQCVWKSLSIDPYYEISDTGLIRNNKNILTPTITNKGYLRITLRNKKHYFIHSLVMNEFNPSDSKLYINHKNGIKTDNRIDNLEWVTASYNLKHAYDNNLKIGVSKYAVYCSEYDITTIGTSKMTSILNSMGILVHSSGISRAITSKTHEHLGLHFYGIKLEELTLGQDIENLNITDLIYLCISWYVKCNNDFDVFSNSMKKYKNKFNISDQLIRIFENTIKELDA